MKRFVLIVFVAIVLATGAYHLENSIISFVHSLLHRDDSVYVTGPAQPVCSLSLQPFPVLFEPSPTPEPNPDKICFTCDGSGECYYCDGVGVVFGSRFGIYSGYGMDTLLDKVCFLCKGYGICRYCK